MTPIAHRDQRKCSSAQNPAWTSHTQQPDGRFPGVIFFWRHSPSRILGGTKIFSFFLRVLAQPDKQLMEECDVGT
jgi:hypothetical protein